METPTDKQPRALVRFWRSIPAPIRKPFVALAGVLVLIAGLIMLITPGPGWLAIFLGLAILATEFAVALRLRNWLLAKFKKAWDAAQELVKKKEAKARVPAKDQESEGQ